MIGILDVARAEADLAAGELACPNCGATLRRWGHARTRRCHFSESTARIPGVLRTSFPDTGDGGSAGGTRSPTHVGV